MRIRPLLLATVFGALCLPSFADPAPMNCGSENGVKHPSPIAGGGPSPMAMAHGGGPTIKPTLRVGDGRVEAARRAAEAEKIKSQQK